MLVLDQMNSSLFPEVEYGDNRPRDDVADDCGADFFLREKGIAHLLDLHVSSVDVFFVNVEVGKGFLPCDRGGCSMRRLSDTVLRDSAEVIFDNALDDCLNERVFLHFEELRLDVIKHLLATGSSNHKCLSSPSTLEGNLSSILQVTNHKILLDHGFRALVPVSILRDSLCNSVRMARINFVSVACDGTCTQRLLRRSNLLLGLGSLG